MSSRPGPSRRPLLFLLSIVIVAVGFVASAGSAQAADDGSGLRMLTAAHRGEPIPGLPARCTGVPAKCEIGPQRKNAPTLVLWGDSHAWQLIPAVRAAIGQDRVNLVAFLYGGCPPHHSGLSTQTDVRAASPCKKINYRALKYVTNQKRLGRDFRVVLAGGWELYRYALNPNSNPGGWQEETAPSIRNAAKFTVRATPRLFRTLGTKKIAADVVGQMPTVPTNAPECAEGEEPYACPLPREAALPSASYIRAYVGRQHALLTRPALLIDPTPFFCTRTQCAGKVAGQSAYYRDNTHISLTLSALLRPYFEPTVARLLAK